MSGLPRTLGEIRAKGKGTPNKTWNCKELQQWSEPIVRQGRAEGINMHVSSSHALICGCLPLAKPNQKPEGKGTWVMESVEFRFLGYGTKQRKMENRSVWKKWSIIAS